MPPREEPVTTQRVADLYAVDERTVKRWLVDGAPHRKRSGRNIIFLSEFIPWRRKQDKAELRASDSPDLAAEQARKMRADADLSELKVLQMRGDLVASAQVEADMERLCSVLRARVLSLRGRWAPKVLGLGTMAEATAVLDALASDMIAALRESGDDLDDEPTEEAAA